MAFEEFKDQTFSGADIMIIISMPLSSSAFSKSKTPYKVSSEIQTLTVSSATSVLPVRRCGEARPKSYTKGARTFAGSMVFVIVDNDPFKEIFSIDAINNSTVNDDSWHIDQLPPFDIIVIANNELGGIGAQIIHNIRIVNWGTTYSIDDMYTEYTYCVDTSTEALTKSGWKAYDQLTSDDYLLTINPDSKNIEWQKLESVYTFPYNEELYHWENYRGIDSLTTPNHRWLTMSAHAEAINGFSKAKTRFDITEELPMMQRSIIVGGGEPNCFIDTPIYSNEFVELVGWVVTEGTYVGPKEKRYGVVVSQSESHNPEYSARITNLVTHYNKSGCTATKYNANRKIDPSQKDYYFGKGIGSKVIEILPDKQLTPEFLCSLTRTQAELLHKTMIDGDGTRKMGNNSEHFTQKSNLTSEMFQMLSAMLGFRTKMRHRENNMTCTTVYHSKTISSASLNVTKVPYNGLVWCPRTKNMTWLARRNGGTFWTGNSYVAEHVTPMLSSHLEIQQKEPKFINLRKELTPDDLFATLSNNGELRGKEKILKNAKRLYSYPDNKLALAYSFASNNTLEPGSVWFSLVDHEFIDPGIPAGTAQELAQDDIRQNQ